VGSAEEDRPFRHYTLRHRLVAWCSRSFFDRCTYTVRHGLLAGMKRKGGLGWLPARFAGPESAEIRFWRTLALDGLTVYDIGAFEGLLSMFFARRARQVVAYEPNPENCTRLMENLRLNRLENVVVRKLGLGREVRNLEMVWDPSMPGGASLETQVADQLRRGVPSVRTHTISISTLDRDRGEAGLPAPDLIKIDIEGWELEALCGARQTLLASRPALFLEMHGETLREKKQKVAAIVEFLNDAGYQEIRHIESGAAITRANSAAACQGHLYAASPRADA